MTENVNVFSDHLRVFFCKYCQNTWVLELVQQQQYLDEIENVDEGWP
jgi:hypothetical protein